MATNRNEKSRLTLTVDEAAVLLGIGRILAYEAVARGEIPSIRVGRRYLVPVAALGKLLAEASSQRLCELCQQPVPIHKVSLTPAMAEGYANLVLRGNDDVPDRS